jgi:hypothetical protein
MSPAEATARQGENKATSRRPNRAPVLSFQRKPEAQMLFGSTRVLPFIVTRRSYFL